MRDTDAGPRSLELDGASVVVDDGTGRTRTLLHPTTLTLTERRIAIIGANGSGKSTLVRLLVGLLVPTTGAVRVHGHDTRRNGTRVRGLVGLLFADPEAQLLMPTPLEDVALSLRHLPRRERTGRATALLTDVGLGSHLHQPVTTLSGGQKQLLALTSVIAASPSVLLADEPTTLLDLRWKVHVEALLDALPQQVLTVTHDLAAAALAERVLVVDQGRVVADGTPADAIAAYRDLMTGPPPELAAGPSPLVSDVTGTR
ncbi:energy-coupling factor ABC transporter ATP-binding protein [Sanguibacter sp. A247]|uniref:energy-coupling factor ABC transporter ATP-binding protein n=1 Tax=unclassified Sanguibacter TaxID=2645534 RepID=UPI003FD6D7B4